MISQDIDLTRAAWRKSTYSGGNGGQCIEVATNLPGIVAVRDSKDHERLVLVVRRQEWRAFVRKVKAGEISFS
jgi:hypothetical protein